MKYQFKKYEKTELLRNHLHMGGANPKGERIEVTSRYLEKAGKPWIGVMGEYHFVRDSRDRWYEELCKMKAGGITIVATYMFWIYHEETEGVFDFTGDRDVRGFVEAAEQVGLEVLLRIGPWAHGECRNGGFPDWLLQKPYKLREDNPQYLAQVRSWYEKIYEQVQGLFYQDGGNIIGIQIENELVDNAEHLLTLKKLAQEIGLQAPLYTVTGWNSKYGAKIPVEEVLPVFGGYPEAPWAGHTNRLPLSIHYDFQKMRNDTAIGEDLIKGGEENGWQLPYENYPYATCELGGGIQPTHHRRPIISAMDVYALSLTKLGSGNNLVGYYMYHGGTNKIGRLSTLNESRATGYPNDYSILSYDFQAPISEYGELREQYRMLNLLHLFVNDFGDRLAPMELVEATTDRTIDNLQALRYAMRTDAEGGFVFINHYQRLAKLADVREVEIQAQGICFPTFDVTGENSFFLPFGMDLSGHRLQCATAQPLCRVENTYFFMAINGILPVYVFADEQLTPERETEKGKIQYRMLAKEELRIVTLTPDEALYARKLDGKLYIGEDCDLFQKGQQLCAAEKKSFRYRLWNDGAWESYRVNAGITEKLTKEAQTEEKACETAEEEKKGTAIPLIREEMTQAPFVPAYEEELQLGGKRRRTWQKLTVTQKEGFVEIADICDVEQIYADGTLVADNFYYGRPWRVPARLLYGKECYLVMSEWKDDFYREWE